MNKLKMFLVMALMGASVFAQDSSDADDEMIIPPTPVAGGY